MLRYAFTPAATTDFSQMTHIVLLSATDTLPSPPLASHLYIKNNALPSGDCTIYMYQVNEESSESLLMPLYVPRNILPKAISKKFSTQTITIPAGEYNNNDLSELSERIEPLIRRNFTQSDEKTSAVVDRQPRTTFCEKTAGLLASILIGFAIGAGLGELIEPGVNKVIGHEFDEDSDVPFSVMTGTGGVAIALLIRCCMPKIEVPKCTREGLTDLFGRCNTSLMGMFGRCRRGSAVAPSELKNVASDVSPLIGQRLGQ